MFSEAKLQELRKLNILGKKLFQSNFFGSYRTFLKSSGFDFVQLQEYQDGDDIRFLDWNAFARTGGSLMTKKMAPEQDRAVIIAVDGSASLNFSSEKTLKSSLARDFVYAMSWLASINKDKVGLAIFDKEEVSWQPCLAGKNQVFSLFNMASEKIGKMKSTSITKGLQFLTGLPNKKSLIFFVSDFLDSNFFKTEKEWLSLAKKHYLIPVCISDKLEKSFEMKNFVFSAQDPETDEMVEIESSELLNLFLKKRQEDIISFFRKKNLNPLILDTSTDLVQKVIHFFSNQRI